MKKLNDVITDLIELHELGHPRIEYAMIYFPMRALRYIENVATNSGHYDLVSKILLFIY